MENWSTYKLRTKASLAFMYILLVGYLREHIRFEVSFVQNWLRWKLLKIESGWWRSRGVSRELNKISTRAKRCLIGHASLLSRYQANQRGERVVQEKIFPLSFSVIIFIFLRSLCRDPFAIHSYLPSSHPLDVAWGCCKFIHNPLLNSSFT